MKFKVVKRCQEDLSSIHGLLKSFLPFARKRMGFNKPPTIFFQSDQGNAQKLLGKTAHYEPGTGHITVYVTGRHPKDVLRSLSHELVHHGQNCRGEFGHTPDTAPGYAQTDSHMRRMEEEAYSVGNLCFRDWEDSVKSGKIRIPMPLKESLFKEEQAKDSNYFEEPGTIVLRRGMGMSGTRDEKVARMQSLLIQAMGPSVLPKHGIDGRYGPETEEGVKKFQVKHGLKDTGVVDTLTLQSLERMGDTEAAEKSAEQIIAAIAVSGAGGSARFAADPSYRGGLTEEYERVSPRKLYKDLISAGLNRNLSKALVANAKGESGFVIAIAGDQGTYARVRFAGKSIPFNRKGPSCSLGLWQFNICGGLGLEFMKAKGLTHEDDDELIYKTITNYSNQIEFMSSYLLNMRNLPVDATDEEYIKWLVRNVIRPAKMAKATKLRIGHLQSLKNSGVFEDTLEEWKNEELNKLLLQKFNLGVIK